MEPKQKTEQDTTVGKEHFVQKTEYLDEKLLAYSQTDAYPFHMPGHKRQSMGNWTGEAIDITEITGFDNLHHAEGILQEAQCRAAETFGADETFFLINGSTAGLLSAICGTVRRGGRLLMARNCHKAVYHAVYLMELKTAYLYPEQTDFGIQGSISPEQVRDMLEQYPYTEAVLLTSPTYDGVVSDNEAVRSGCRQAAFCAHSRYTDPRQRQAPSAEIPVRNRNAHRGPHPRSVVHLFHAPELQSLQYRKNPWIDLERVKQYLGIYQTSSPSYILMAGIDRCTRILREQGTELFAAYEQRLHDFYEKCRTLQRIPRPDARIIFPVFSDFPIRGKHSDPL